MSTATTDPVAIPSLSLGTFNFGFAANVPLPPAAPVPAPVQPPPLGVLAQLVGKTFRGPGYNCIFRPRSKTPLQGQAVPPPASTQDNDLQLSLTVEALAFSDKVLGKVPNRGLGDQPDVILAGISYVDSVTDITTVPSEDIAKGDTSKGEDIHFEPGLWMNVPPTKESGVLKGTLCRMASIPHGTTINAQGVAPSEPLTPTPNAPTFDPVVITPFFTATKASTGKFNNQTLTTKENRVPSDLDAFKSE